MQKIPRSLAYDMLFGSNKGDAHDTLDKIYESFEPRNEVNMYKDNKVIDSITVEKADFSNCPVCGSINITYGDSEEEAFFIYRIHSCDECFSTWEERYDLTQVRIESAAYKNIEKVK